MSDGQTRKTLEREWRELVTSLALDETRSPLQIPPQLRFPVRPCALFAELEDVRRAWAELRELPLQEYQNRFVNPGWTLRELLAHLASWAREFRFEVETAARGGTFDYAIPFALTVIGPNQWNQEQVAARRHMTLAEVLDEIEQETARLQELVLDLPPESLVREADLPFAPSGDPEERLRGTAAQQVLGKCHHDRHHIAQIRHKIQAWSGDWGS